MYKSIIPELQSIKIFEKELVVKSVYNFEAIQNTYARVYKYLLRFISSSEQAEASIIFKIDEALGREEYKIIVDEDITIISSGEEGAFRASATLRQILAHKTIRQAELHDYPMIAKRGFMLDISRGRVPKLTALKEYVDILANLKYNQFQLYLEDIVFEFEHYKEFCDDVISIEELRELVDYCESMFIDLVPNQNSLGHMKHWVKLPEIAKFAICDDNGNATETLNPLDERTISFVDTLYADLIPHFKSDFMNICMDEPKTLGTGSSEADCERLGRYNIYLDYLNQVVKLVNEKYHKTPMFWDDIIMQNTENIRKIPKDAVAMSWGYEENWPYSGRCKLLQEHKVRFYTCPSASNFCSFTGRFNNMVENIENAAVNCILYGGEGLLLTEWGDCGHSQFAVTFFMPLIFASCCSWHYRSASWPWEMTTVAHLDYARSTDIITKCEKYADEFIFGVQGMGRALHKAANYYLMENDTIFSGSKLFYDMLSASNGKMLNIDADSLKMVADYINVVKKEFASMPQLTPHLDEILCNCDMVSLCAEALLCIESGAGAMEKETLFQAIQALRKRYIELWNRSSRERGSEIMGNILENLANHVLLT